MNIEIHRMNGGSHVFGPNGTVIHHGTAPDQLAAAVALLVEAVRAHAPELAEPDRARSAVLAVRGELTAARPRKERLLALLRDTAKGAGDVAAVIGAVQGVAELVHALP